MARAKAQPGQIFLIRGPDVRLLISESADGEPCIIFRRDSTASAPCLGKNEAVRRHQTSRWVVDEVPGQKTIVSFYTNDPPDTATHPASDIRTKISLLWPGRAKDLDIDCEKWTTNPAAFYGVEGTCSGLQYCLRGILDAANGRDHARRVMQMATLAREVDEGVAAIQRIDPDYLESTFRKGMFDELYTGYCGNDLSTDDTEKKRKADRRTFDYCIQLGRVVNAMDAVHPAFSLTIAPLLTRDNLLFIRQHPDPPYEWIETPILEEIAKYNTPARVVGAYLQKIAVFETSSRPFKRARTVVQQDSLALKPPYEMCGQSGMSLNSEALTDTSFGDPQHIPQPGGAAVVEATLTSEVPFNPSRHVDAYLITDSVQNLEDYGLNWDVWSGSGFVCRNSVAGQSMFV